MDEPRHRYQLHSHHRQDLRGLQPAVKDTTIKLTLSEVIQLIDAMTSVVDPTNKTEHKKLLKRLFTARRRIHIYDPQPEES